MFRFHSLDEKFHKRSGPDFSEITVSRDGFSILMFFFLWNVEIFPPQLQVTPNGTKAAPENEHDFGLLQGRDDFFLRL